MNKNKKELLKGEKLVDAEWDKTLDTKPKNIVSKKINTGGVIGSTSGEELKSSNKQTIIKDMVKKLHTDVENSESTTGSKSSQTFATTSTGFNVGSD